MDDPKFTLEIDLNELTKEFDNITKEVENDLKEAAQSLSDMTRAKVNELADEKLSSRKKEYTDNLYFEEVEQGVWVITLAEPAMWIEEGVNAGSMVDNLLKKGAKTNKDGQRYKAIPFDHFKKPSQQSPKAAEYTQAIKQEMKKKGIPFRKLELGKDGSPRVGMLHRFSIESDKPTNKAKTMALKNVQVYQTKDKATGTTRRDILTFRIVHDKHKDEGLWMHPGLQGVKIFDEAFDWALNTWEREIVPSILNKS